MEPLHQAEWLLGIVASAVAIVAEAIAIGIIAAAAVVAVWETVRAAFTRAEAHPWVDVRLDLARYLALALEFLLAADVVRTAVAPNWEEIGKLAAIAIIRTGLNYFLQREMRQEEREQDERERHERQRKQQERDADDDRGGPGQEPRLRSA